MGHLLMLFCQGSKVSHMMSPQVVRDLQSSGREGDCRETFWIILNNDAIIPSKYLLI